MIFYKYTKHAFVPMFLLFAQNAGATCASGTPDANQILMDTLNEPAALAWVNQFMERGEGWTSSRGNGDLTATDLEFSKFFLGAYLLGNGVVNNELQVSQNASGTWEYTPGQIYLSSAFHRSRDEWTPLISDTDWTVCDSLSPTDGTFDCVKERFRKWPAPMQYRWFGYPSDTNIFNSTSDTEVNTSHFAYDPDTTETIIYEEPFRKKREVKYFCPLFEDDQGNFDQMVLPRAVINLVVSSWSMALDRRPKVAPNLAFVASPTHSHRREAIGRNDSDNNLSQIQVGHEAMCDLAVAAQSWVPLMVTEVMSEGFRDEADTVRYESGTPDGSGKVGFNCTSMRDPLVQMTPTEEADCGTAPSCDERSDCSGQYNECWNSCCITLR